MKVTTRVLGLLEKSLEGRDLHQLIAILNNMYPSFPQEAIHLTTVLRERSDYSQLLNHLEFEV